MCLHRYLHCVDVTGKEALLVYQDDSSDEMEDVMNDLLVPASDTDDDFDEEEGDETMEVFLLHHRCLAFLNIFSQGFQVGLRFRSGNSERGRRDGK